MIEYRDVYDKSDWGDGPWQSEPDKKQWRDAATGLPCLIVRNQLGALCGYVGVYPTHPLHGKDYNETPDLEVHGGLTFSKGCADEGDQSKTICHVPDEGEPPVWWFGFDCAHWMDYSPGLYAREKKIMPAHLLRRHAEETYRDLAYVKNEVATLARQLAALEPEREQEKVAK